MRVDIEYGARVNKKFVQDWWLTNGQYDPESAVGIMANATMVPCINIVYWIAEVENWNEKFREHAKTLMKFYGYTEIVNKPEGCPW